MNRTQHIFAMINELKLIGCNVLRSHSATCTPTLLFAIVACLVHSLQAAEPFWSSDRTNRVLVTGEPVKNLPRPNDEMVARVHVDFSQYLGKATADLSTLQVV